VFGGTAAALAGVARAKMLAVDMATVATAAATRVRLFRVLISWCSILV
jgi:hypothetical protein